MQNKLSFAKIVTRGRFYSSHSRFELAWHSVVDLCCICKLRGFVKRPNRIL